MLVDLDWGIGRGSSPFRFARRSPPALEQICVEALPVVRLRPAQAVKVIEIVSESISLGIFLEYIALSLKPLETPKNSVDGSPRAAWFRDGFQRRPGARPTRVAAPTPPGAGVLDLEVGPADYHDDCRCALGANDRTSRPDRPSQFTTPSDDHCKSGTHRVIRPTRCCGAVPVLGRRARGRRTVVVHGRRGRFAPMREQSLCGVVRIVDCSWLEADWIQSSFDGRWVNDLRRRRLRSPPTCPRLY